ncbi:MAG: hypothetical protein JNM25_09160 [Planctomycetes bacterium]|nr:hypothetical protein [Planctomycetota bacterium]
MPSPEPDLDHLTNLLSLCLGRIEEHAFQLQDETDARRDPAVADAIEDEASLLQELVGSLLVCAVDEHADLNATVERALRSCVGEVNVPIVVRQRLAPRLPKIACPPADLAYAVQRALVLAIGRLAPGGEIAVTTRREHDTVLFEVESRGVEVDRHLAERSETLAEFVVGLRGHCRVHSAADDTLLLAFELPIALALDDR